MFVRVFVVCGLFALDMEVCFSSWFREHTPSWWRILEEGKGLVAGTARAPVSGSRRLLAPTAVDQKVKKGDQVFQIPGLYTQSSLNIPLQQHKGEQ